MDDKKEQSFSVHNVEEIIQWGRDNKTINNNNNIRDGMVQSDNNNHKKWTILTGKNHGFF